MASNQLVVGDGSRTFEVGAQYNVPIVLISGYILTDPASFVLVLRDPDSISFTFTYPVGATLLTRSTTGIYSFAFTPVLVGRHVYTVTSTVPTLVSSGEFQVIAQGVM